MLIDKAKTAFWFARRPRFWAHAAALGVRKLLPDRDSRELRLAAHSWAAENAVSIDEVFERFGFASARRPLDQRLIIEGQRRAQTSPFKMGGAAALDVLHQIVAASGARRIVETGVAYGWSSLAILAALPDDARARLISVDMPYPKMGNESCVGIVVPEALRQRWTLIRQPDRYGLSKALSLLGGQIDLCHYDSDKSWWGRHYAYSVLWDALKPGGVFISDDIQDNLYFRDFILQRTKRFAVVESDKKFAGLALKPE